MNIEGLRKDISAIIDHKACGGEFFFLLDTAGKMSIKRADIDGVTQAELTENFIDSIRNTILLNTELSLMNLSAADERANVIYRYDLPKVPSQLTHMDTLTKRDDFGVFDFTADDFKNLHGILILLGHGQKQLVLYKHQYPVALLKHDSSFSLIRMRNQNRLVKLDDDILRINPKFEFMHLDNHYYIADLKTLERFFGFHDVIRSVAAQGITNIANSGLVVDTSLLTSRLDDISFSRKLVRAANASPVLGQIPNKDVIAFVGTHPVLRGKFKLSKDGTKIKLETKASQNLFLKLLNDDFLQSELTKRYYDSLAKDDLQTGA